MIDPSEAADDPSPTDPASRLGEALKQFTLANEEIGSDVSTLHHKLAIETAWIQRHLDVDIVTNVKRNSHATVTVQFDDGTTPAEATSALAGIADPDKTQTTHTHRGEQLTVAVRLLYGERYRDEVDAEAESDQHLVTDGGTSSVSIQSDHGELKRRLAELIGTDPSRYAADTGNERHRKLTTTEVDALCEALGIGFVDGRKKQKMDTVMIKLGRDHRTGVGMWDASDLVAVIERLEGGVSA